MKITCTIGKMIYNDFCSKLKNVEFINFGLNIDDSDLDAHTNQPALISYTGVQAGERGFKPASVHLYASKYKYP
jgi:hypothetical protein